MAGAGTLAKGSLIGAAVAQFAPINPGGGVLGWPVTPKSLPLKLGPPLLRSMVGPPELHPFGALVVAAAQLSLLELT